MSDYKQSIFNSVIHTKSGNVGIGTTTPQYNLDIFGSARILHMKGASMFVRKGFTGWMTTSDIRMKKNVQNIDRGLEDLIHLRPVTFEWKESEEKKLGFIAQEVMEVLPELVGKSDNDMLAVNTNDMIPILVKAIQELNVKVELLANMKK